MYIIDVARIYLSMYLKTYNWDKITVVAVCDEDIVGKVFREGKLRLYVDERFYKGHTVGREQMLHSIASADISNITGKKSVTYAIEAGEVDKENVLYIEGVPHAQIIKIRSGV
ncbi:MAG: DUF424 domain-containing protein [Methermicoccaceae archaeon]